MSHWTQKQVVFDDAVLTATVALASEFMFCPTKVVEITTTAFSGTLNIKGSVGGEATKDNVAYRLMGSQVPFPAVAQLSWTTDTGRYRYLVTDSAAFIDFVMTRSAGTIRCTVIGYDYALPPLSPPAFSFSPVAVADVQVKAGPGVLHSVTFSCADATPTAGSVDIYDGLTATGNKVFSWAIPAVYFVPFTLVLDALMATGIYVDFTTTGDVNVVCSYL